MRYLTTNDFAPATLQKSAYKPVIDKIFTFLDEYFKGNRPKIDFKIMPKGSELYLKVWDELLKIPYENIRTYKEIAEMVFAKKTCPQAVGGAVGRNPILIVIPCHRVLGAEWSLTGFSTGLSVKRWLLNYEKIGLKE